MDKDRSEPQGFRNGRNNAGLRPGHGVRVLVVVQDTLGGSLRG